VMTPGLQTWPLGYMLLSYKQAHGAMLSWSKHNKLVWYWYLETVFKIIIFFNVSQSSDTRPILEHKFESRNIPTPGNWRVSHMIQITPWWALAP
jgi:hypothetical protein